MTAKQGDCVQTLTDFMEDSLKDREDGDYSSLQCRLKELEEDGRQEAASIPKNLLILLNNRTWRANSWKRMAH